MLTPTPEAAWSATARGNLPHTRPSARTGLRNSATPSPEVTGLTATALTSGAASELELVRQRPQQLGGRLGGAGVGVAAVAVGLADVVEQPDQVLDDRGHLLGLLAPRGGLV